jgi:hypothetical protein
MASKNLFRLVQKTLNWYNYSWNWLVSFKTKLYVQFFLPTGWCSLRQWKNWPMGWVSRYVTNDSGTCCTVYLKIVDYSWYLSVPSRTYTTDAWYRNPAWLHGTQNCAWLELELCRRFACLEPWDDGPGNFHIFDTSDLVLFQGLMSVYPFVRACACIGG